MKTILSAAIAALALATLAADSGDPILKRQKEGELMRYELELQKLEGLLASSERVGDLKVERERLRGIVSGATELTENIKTLQKPVAEKEEALRKAQAEYDAWISANRPSQWPVLNFLTSYRALAALRTSVRAEERRLEDNLREAVQQRREIEAQAVQLETLRLRWKNFADSPDPAAPGKDILDCRQRLTELDSLIPDLDRKTPAELRAMADRAAYLRDRTKEIRTELAGWGRSAPTVSEVRPPPVRVEPLPPDPPTLRWPAGKAALSWKVVNAGGSGKPEFLEAIERCTWKFFVEVKVGNGIPASFEIAVVDRQPRQIQKPGSAQPSGGLLPVPLAAVTPSAEAPGMILGTTSKWATEAGPFYLTVEKPTGYRGKFQGVLKCKDENANSFEIPIEWDSPGRPPVGPSQQPQEALIRVISPSPLAGRDTVEIFLDGGDVPSFDIQADKLPPGLYALRMELEGGETRQLWCRARPGQTTRFCGPVPLRAGPFKMKLHLPEAPWAGSVQLNGTVSLRLQALAVRRDLLTQRLKAVEQAKTRLARSQAATPRQAPDDWLDLAGCHKEVAGSLVYLGRYEEAVSACNEALRCLDASGYSLANGGGTYGRGWRDIRLTALSTMARASYVGGRLNLAIQATENRLDLYRKIEAQTPNLANVAAGGNADAYNELARFRCVAGADYGTVKTLVERSREYYRQARTTASPGWFSFYPDW